MIGILCLGAALATATGTRVNHAPANGLIEPGTRVRVTFARGADPSAAGRDGGKRRRAGNVRGVGERTLTFVFDGELSPVEVETASVAKLERSLGRRPRGKGSLRGAGIGLLAGATSGILIGLVSGDDPAGFLAFSAGEKAALYGIGLGAIGTIGGAVAGAARPGERWERGPIVSVNERVGVRLLPVGPRGAGFAVSLGF